MNKPSRAQLGQFGPYSTPTITYLYHNPTLPYPYPYTTLPTPHHTTPHHTTPHHTTPHQTIPYHTLLYLYPYPTPTRFYPYPILPLPYPPLPYFTPTIPHPCHTLPLSYPTPTRPYPYHILFLPYPTLYTWQAFLLKGNFIKILNDIDNCDKSQLFHTQPIQRTRGHSQTLFKRQFRLDLRKHFFSKRVIDDWNNLSENVISSNSINQSKSRLNTFWKDK